MLLIDLRCALGHFGTFFLFSCADSLRGFFCIPPSACSSFYLFIYFCGCVYIRAEDSLVGKHHTKKCEKEHEVVGLNPKAEAKESHSTAGM